MLFIIIISPSDLLFPQKVFSEYEYLLLTTLGYHEYHRYAITTRNDEIFE